MTTCLESENDKMTGAIEESEYEKRIRDVQLAELELLKLFKSICEKYDIKYSLHGGTLLGAIRHGGFIPWDDDLDVILERGEYERFLEVWMIEKPQGYFLQTKESEERFTRNFAKIRKEGTIFLQKKDDPEYVHTGIFMDIEPVDRLPDGILRRLLYFWMVFRYEIYSREYVYGDSVFLTTIGSLLLSIKNHDARLKSCRHLKRKISAYNKEKSLHRIINANLTTMRKILSPDIMDKYKSIRFEDMEVMIITEWEELLIKWYGKEYMKLPPAEMRKPGHKPVQLKL